MKKSSIVMTPIEAQMAAGCIRYYLLYLLGEAAEGRVVNLYGDKLVREMAKKPRKGAPLGEQLKNPKTAKLLKQLVILYGRVYKEATPIDVEFNVITGEPCSYDQHMESLAKWAS